MKKRNKNAFIAAISITILGATYSLDIVPPSQTVWKNLKKEQLAHHKSSSISLPQSVRYAIAEKYAAHAVKEFSVTQKGNYRVILKNEHSRLIVHYSPDGEYLKQEMVKPIQIVALR